MVDINQIWQALPEMHIRNSSFNQTHNTLSLFILRLIQPFTFSPIEVVDISIATKKKIVTSAIQIIRL